MSFFNLAGPSLISSGLAYVETFLGAWGSWTSFVSSGALVSKDLFSDLRLPSLVNLIFLSLTSAKDCDFVTLFSKLLVLLLFFIFWGIYSEFLAWSSKNAWTFSLKPIISSSSTFLNVFPFPFTSSGSELFMALIALPLANSSSKSVDETFFCFFFPSFLIFITRESVDPASLALLILPSKSDPTSWLSLSTEDCLDADLDPHFPFLNKDPKREVFSFSVSGVWLLLLLKVPDNDLKNPLLDSFSTETSLDWIMSSSDCWYSSVPPSLPGSFFIGLGGLRE